MSVQRVNGWRWCCSMCGQGGIERLKREAVAAEEQHRAMHNPLTITYPWGSVTYTTYSGMLVGYDSTAA